MRKYLLILGAFVCGLGVCTVGESRWGPSGFCAVAQTVPVKSTCCSDLSCVKCETESLAIELCNAERVQRGLPPFKRSATLVTSCRQHCYRQHARNSMHHGSSNGLWAAENVAAGSTTPQGAIRQWMNSPPHRGTMLSRRYTRVGISKSGRYWTMQCR